MANLSLRNINKIYDNGFHAVKDFNMEIEDKEFIIFVGPSGCGKSTTLRMIAGLEEISNGTLEIDGVKMNDTLPKDRDIAMVFQNYALYPHMTIYDNMAFSLKINKMSKDEIDKKVREAAEILGITNLLDRKPKQLSGGQRQRVAMGRAIVRNPKVFLMDEPLSNLDAKLRVQMRIEIARLHKKLGTTMIYVTHDQTEAMTLGTRIVVMKDGEVQQIDSPQMLYDHPNNLFVASFIGSPQINLIETEVTEVDAKNYLVNPYFKFEMPADKAKVLKDNGYVGKKVIFGIRPESIHVADEVPGDCLPSSPVKSVVKVYELMGSEVHLYFDLGETQMIAKASSRTKAKEGEEVDFIFALDKSYLFDPETELLIQ